jgi:alcohol dehydrogenase
MISREYYTHLASVQACDQRMIAMAKAMGNAEATDAMDFVQALVALQKACNVDTLKMSDYQITKEELLPMVANARANMGGLFSVDPVVLSDEDCLKIYSRSFA